MAELTQEQVDAALKLVNQKRIPLTAAELDELAILVQLPWDEPKESDFPTAKSNAGYILEHALPFVRRRNASLLKAVDPRREKIKKVLQTQSKDQWYDLTVDQILAALDEVE